MSAQASPAVAQYACPLAACGGTLVPDWADRANAGRRVCTACRGVFAVVPSDGTAATVASAALDTYAGEAVELSPTAGG